MFFQSLKLLPVILLTFQYFKEKEQSYFKYPTFQLLIFDILPIGLIRKYDEYYYTNLLSIYVYHFTTEIIGILEINEQEQQLVQKRILTIMLNILIIQFYNQQWKQYGLSNQYQQKFSCCDLNQIGNQYFTSQYLCLNLFKLLFNIMKEGKGRIVEYNIKKQKKQNQREKI
ncbi:unnamed protein product [Paramecium sonneborni]|uniref:Uncharacterized protein n=1 Tax=Paramecium sonneborni TaxID=65129 RepID=A0A8S1NI13_9CILI|nr:unnamed protein product [Paramecium sonneborni]